MYSLQAFGSNGSGQLGLGDKEDVSIPQPVPLPTSLTTTAAASSCTAVPKLDRIVAGGNHTLLLFSSGDLLWSGDHTSGACGPVVTNGESHTRFRPVSLNHLPEGSKVRQMAATWAASAVVVPSNEGDADKIYCFGAGDKGELGLGQDTPRAPEPTQIPNFPPFGTRVVDIAACMGHVVAVLSNGEVWGWGNGRKGQLGEPAAGAVYSPRRIEGIGFEVVKAVCGREFTCLFGPPETGRMAVLGSDKWGVKSQAPRDVTGWKEVGASWGSVFVLGEDGALLGWGRNDHGQLAQEGLGRLETMAVGSEHALAVTQAGDLMAWGWGEHGNCGLIRDVTRKKLLPNRVFSAEQLEPAKITMVGAGCATSWVVTERRT